MKYKFKKGTGSDSTVGRIAQGITNVVGGKGITDYAGGRGTKMGALRGVANVVATVGSGGAGILRMAGKKATKVVVRKAAESAIDRKYRIQDAYDYAQRAAKNAKKKK